MSLVKKLRLSVASSDTHDSDDVTIDETCGFEIGCGSCKSRRFPAYFCQRFATSRWALVFISLGAVMQGFIVNGHTPVVISTIEKRFELSSTESGLIASCNDIAGSITILFVTYVGGRGHKPLWIGWSIFLIGLSGIVFSLPHFIAPHYSFLDQLNICGEADIGTCTLTTLKNFRFVFYAALLMAGTGGSALYSLSITYLDENVKQRYSSMYNGILIAMSIVGPGVGFLVGAAFLQWYTYPSETVSITESNELWVGAWWIGALIIGLIGIVISIPTLMLPRVIPRTEKHREDRSKEVHHTAVDGAEEEFGKRFRDFPKCVLTILRNPPFLFLSLGIAVDSLLIGAMATFGAKYLETQFGIDASNAGTYFGLMAILGGAGGQLAGGGLISKYNLNVRWMLHMTYICPILAAASSCCYLITCTNLSFAGITTAYHDSTPGIALSPASCNANCGCSSSVYSPVCGSDKVTYFSSCFAGCTSRIGDVYGNCSCVAATASGPPFNFTDQATATTGACSDDSCSSGWQLVVFCVFTFLLMFLTFFNEASALQVSLRCVGFTRRSFAVGIQILFTRVLGTVPGPLILGAIFDRSCLKWTEECGTQGSCLAYDNQTLSLYVFLFLLVGKIVDFFLFLIAKFLYKQAPDALPKEYEDSIQEEDRSVSKPSAITGNGDEVGPVKTQPQAHERNGSALPGEILTPNPDQTNGFFTNPAFNQDGSKEIKK